MQLQIFDLSRQYKELKSQIDHAIEDVISRSAFINGTENKLFEEAFAKYCQTKHAIGVSSGSSALTLALRAIGIQKDDEVICPSHTFAATAEAIVHCLAKPVFVDIEEKTYNIDPSLIEQAITSRTKAIIAVDLYGQTADFLAINKIAKKHNLFVIEDAAQAHGAVHWKKKAGSLADIACFSFFPAKNLGCYGDGGGVTTNNDELAQKIGLLKDHGRTSKYHHEIVGYGERLDNLQAAILLQKLPYLDKWNTRRREIAQKYSQDIKDDFIKPFVNKGNESVFYVYTLRHPQRHKIMDLLKKEGIDTGIYYPEPLHLQPAFANFGYKVGSLPITEKIAEEIFSIPIFPELTDKEVNFITTVINRL